MPAASGQTLDNTFGPEVKFVKAPPPGQVNLPPSAGLQFFGEVRIDCRSSALTVHLRDLTGASLWQTTLQPQRGPVATGAARASQDATCTKRRLQRNCTARAAWSAV